jgi:hypothetical protein
MNTGSTTWFRDCHGFDGGACVGAPSGPELGGVHVNASPFGAKRLADQPSHRRRFAAVQQLVPGPETGLVTFVLALEIGIMTYLGPENCLLCVRHGWAGKGTADGFRR